MAHRCWTVPDILIANGIVDYPFSNREPCSEDLTFEPSVFVDGSEFKLSINQIFERWLTPSDNVHALEVETPYTDWNFLYVIDIVPSRCKYTRHLIFRIFGKTWKYTGPGRRIPVSACWNVHGYLPSIRLCLRSNQDSNTCPLKEQFSNLKDLNAFLLHHISCPGFQSEQPEFEFQIKILTHECKETSSRSQLSRCSFTMSALADENSYTKFLRIKNSVWQGWVVSSLNIGDSETHNFMSHFGISCSKWLKTDDMGKTSFRTEDKDCTESACILEMDIHNTSIEVVNESETLSRLSLPDLRVLSFDIETFNNNEIDTEDFTFNGSKSVAQIGFELGIYSVVESKILEDSRRPGLIMSGTGNDIPGVKVFQFYNKAKGDDREIDLKKERQLESMVLEAFQCLVQKWDPDVITGFNIEDFDFPVIAKRCMITNNTVLGYFGRNRCSKLTNVKLEVGPIERATTITSVRIDGRIVIDMFKQFQLWQNTTTKQEFRLSNVSKLHCPSELQKLDCCYDDMSVRYDSDINTRTNFGKYCVRDAQIPLFLLGKAGLFKDQGNLSPICFQLRSCQLRKIPLQDCVVVPQIYWDALQFQILLLEHEAGLKLYL